MSDYGFTAADTLTQGEINAANPAGIPLGVSTPGGSPFVVPGASFPALPQQGAPPAQLGNTITGATIAAPSIAPVTGATTTANNPTGAAPAAAATTSPSWAPSVGSLSDWFARAIIVVLGFIFVAVSLNMMRPGTVPLLPKGTGAPEPSGGARARPAPRPAAETRPAERKPAATPAPPKAKAKEPAKAPAKAEPKSSAPLTGAAARKALNDALATGVKIKAGK